MSTNLIQLGDDYAETRHICGTHLYNLKTAAARDAFVTAVHAQAAEIERLRELAATCYAGLGAECNLPEAWLDALNAAASGEPFNVEGLLPFKADAQPAVPAHYGPLRDADAEYGKRLQVYADIHAQPAAPQGGAGAELTHEQVSRIVDAVVEHSISLTQDASGIRVAYDPNILADAIGNVLRASNGQAPAGATRADSRACYLCGHSADAHPMEPDPQGGMRRGACPAPTAQLLLAGGVTAEPGWKSEDFEVTHYPPMPTTGLRVGMPKGVKVLHRPTGLFAVSEEERSQHRNREVAWNKLQEMLAAAPTPAAQAMIAAALVAELRAALAQKEGR